MHLDEGIKALKNGDNQGAMMHLNGAYFKGLSTSSSGQSAKMHLDAGIQALKLGDNQGAMMHLNGARSGSRHYRLKHKSYFWN